MDTSMERKLIEADDQVQALDDMICSKIDQPSRAMNMALRYWPANGLPLTLIDNMRSDKVRHARLTNIANIE
jgi:hypothetical protein